MICTKLSALAISLALVCVVQTSAIAVAKDSTIDDAARTSAIEFTYSPKSSIRAKISETAPTRINFSNNQITEVIGDENKYKLLADGNSFNVFITPKVAAGSIIPMTIIASSNKVQDLLLEVSSEQKLPLTMIISSNLERKDRQMNFSEYNVSHGFNTIEQKNEIELMLKAMLEDDNLKDKYYVTAPKRKLTITHLPKLSIIQDKTWRYKNLTGASLTITNKSSIAANIRAKSLRRLFKNSKLTVIDNNLLKQGNITKAFIITEEEE